MLKLYQSNKLEYLSDLLVELTRQPLSDPMAAEIVVVPHAGLGRWLSLRLAERTGICANVRFPMPAGFIWEMLHSLLGPFPSDDKYSPAVMQWVLYDLLGDVRGDDRFQSAERYIAGSGELGRYALSVQLARSFDQYLVYRPEWITRWQQGGEAVAGDQWQAELWRRLNQKLGGGHWVDLQQQVAKILSSAGPKPGQLPERISLFGVHTLSPGYLQLLQMLSRWTALHFYLLNPCEMDWTGIMEPAGVAAYEAEAGREETYFETGNPLLASLGRQGRDFYGALLGSEPAIIDMFESPGEEVMLHRIQQDILRLQDGTASPPWMRQEGDYSIQIHSCHTPMREVEVLRDQLLGLLQQHPDLQPEDILVMAPELDLYAPYVDAVFGARPPAERIPYNISGHALPGESQLIQTFLRLLELPGGRYQSSELLSLLEVPAIQRRFRINEGDLPTIGHWVKVCAIRWGRDGSGRRELGLPDNDLNSWQAGLDRMLLGYALPAGESRLFQGILPYDEVEGSDSVLLGGLNAFVQTVFSLADLLNGLHPLPQWEQRLAVVLERFLEPSAEDEYALQKLRNLISGMVVDAGVAGLDTPLSLAVVRQQLTERLAGSAAIAGLLASGITFCALTPMRSLPFQVICLIGMNDGSFPRDQRPPGFDLMAGGYRSGDRLRRLDDRYLFLETLVSARRCLYISYTGQDVRDNTQLPPSVFVSELMDYLRHTVVLGTRDRSGDGFPVRHPLQPFSPDYFKADGELFSYASDLLPAARALLSASSPDSDLLTEPLAEPGEDWRQLTLNQLAYFYANPARYLLRERLGILVERSEGLVETRDPFALDWFQRELIGMHLLEVELQGAEAGGETVFSLQRAAGRLPHGQVGRLRFQELERAARELGPELRKKIPPATGSEVELDLSMGGFRLTGRLGSLGSAGRTGYSFNPLSPGGLTGLWLRHLVLNLLSTNGTPAQSIWLSTGESISLAPVPEAARLLEDLLQIYWQGQCSPLHLFPRSSLVFAKQRLKGRDIEHCLASARKTWLGGPYSFSEHQADPYFRLAFPRGEVLDKRFQDLSERVFGPLLGAMG